MIPRFDLNLLRITEKRRTDFLKAAQAEVARFYFSEGSSRVYSVRATPSQLFADFYLKSGYPVSIFLVPFPPIKQYSLFDDARKDLVYEYQRGALELMGIKTEGLFLDKRLDLAAYFRAIRGFDGSQISLPMPLDTYIRKILPSFSQSKTALVSLKRSKRLVIGVRPFIVWNAWTGNPEIYSLTPGVGVPVFDKADLQALTSQGTSGRITDYIDRITLEEL